MKICFIGLGSIASRHIRNLKALYGDEAEITVLRSGIGKDIDPALAGVISQVCVDRKELSSKFNAVFITNPTAQHYDSLLESVDLSDAFFVEKPVFLTGREDLTRLTKGGHKKFYVACPLRYSGVIQYLKREVDFSEVYSVRCISSSYLPDWRPGTDYRRCYSAERKMGGGVALDLIHEWDYLRYLLGDPSNVFCKLAKKSDLEINAEDIAVYIAEYADKLVELHLDYFGRKPQRSIELYTKEDTIRADLIQGRIDYLVNGRSVDLHEDRDDYQKRELEHFVDIMRGKTVSDNDLSMACETLRIARGEK